MTLNSLISNSVIEINFNNKNISFLFLNFTNIKPSELFEFRSYLLKYNLKIMKLNTKLINRVFLKTLKKDVVLQLNTKNFDLSCSNLFYISTENMFYFVYVIFFIFSKYSMKIDFLYIKQNNYFILFYYFKNLFNKFLNILNLKYLSMEEFKDITLFFFQNFLYYLNFFFFKLLFMLKFYLILNFYKLFIQKIFF